MTTSDNDRWETLNDAPRFVLRRMGRFVVAALKGPHHAISTSARHGGWCDHLGWLVNHQSCEGAGHIDRHRAMVEGGMEAYHDRVCAEIGLPPESTAVMGTAANMNYIAVAQETDGDVAVTAVVTAGVEGNATAAGEPATWRETDAGTERVPPHAGTINILLLIDRPLTSAALARAVATMTEGKSAALQRLAVPSKLHVDLATGTGTDQYCIAAPAGTPQLTSASPHMKLGELIGLATRNATLEALRWQNGLEMSYTRGVFHALGRYGIREATVFTDLEPHLTADDLELLKKNSKAAFYEPLTGAAAHALAQLADRARFGTLPASVAGEALSQQAAVLAANLSSQPQRWPEFLARLRPSAAGTVRELAVRAIALGWAEKWRTSD